MKSGNLNFLEPSGPLQACNGTGLPLPFTFYQFPLKKLCKWAPINGDSEPVKAMISLNYTWMSISYRAVNILILSYKAQYVSAV